MEFVRLGLVFEPFPVTYDAVKSLFDDYKEQQKKSSETAALVE